MLTGKEEASLDPADLSRVINNVPGDSVENIFAEESTDNNITKTLKNIIVNAYSGADICPYSRELLLAITEYLSHSKTSTIIISNSNIQRKATPVSGHQLQNILDRLFAEDKAYLEEQIKTKHTELATLGKQMLSSIDGLENDSLTFDDTLFLARLMHQTANGINDISTFDLNAYRHLLNNTAAVLETTHKLKLLTEFNSIIMAGFAFLAGACLIIAMITYPPFQSIIPTMKISVEIASAISGAAALLGTICGGLALYWYAKIKEANQIKNKILESPTPILKNEFKILIDAGLAFFNGAKIARGGEGPSRAMLSTDEDATLLRSK